MSLMDNKSEMTAVDAPSSPEVGYLADTDTGGFSHSSGWHTINKTSLSTGMEPSADNHSSADDEVYPFDLDPKYFDPEYLLEYQRRQREEEEKPAPEADRNTGSTDGGGSDDDEPAVLPAAKANYKGRTKRKADSPAHQTQSKVRLLTMAEEGDSDASPEVLPAIRKIDDSAKQPGGPVMYTGRPKFRPVGRPSQDIGKEEFPQDESAAGEWELVTGKLDDKPVVNGVPDRQLLKIHLRHKTTKKDEKYVFKQMKFPEIDWRNQEHADAITAWRHSVFALRGFFD
ncbi:hypothetical protein CC80DRAFT_504183 [Byssothecium circinans]|uniref:Uncharacterized protein n=1 Tax=Byssothecium circinans TaxID=147558 RepID=A0A6A5U7J1_9PLEO|nr:hypothetical protein CC80DRAFT_504183 [Byssothecium circinans]